MTSTKRPGDRKWLKRVLIAIAAAITTMLVTRRKVLAPSAATFDFQLPTAPERPAPPEPPAAPASTKPSEPALDPTSEGLDTTTQEGEEGAIDLSEEALDIEVDPELEADSAPDLTSEGLDTGEQSQAPAALASGQGFVEMSGDERECPPEFPIKGNASSHIYHQPGESSYERTVPEICFASEEVAQSQGYRPRKHL